MISGVLRNFQAGFAHERAGGGCGKYHKMAKVVAKVLVASKVVLYCNVLDIDRNCQH